MAFIESESELRFLEDSNLCADCNTGDPTHCDVEYGVLLCGQCALLHKNMEVSRVKILDDDQLTQEEIRSVLDGGGNREVNDELEKFLPTSYKKNLAQMNMFVRRQFIERKYTAKRFQYEDSSNGFSESRRIGILLKRSEVSANEWNLQYIVLDRERQVIECLTKGGAFQPEDIIPLDSAKVFIESLDETEGGHCIRISWEKRKGTSTKLSPAKRESQKDVLRKGSLRWKDRAIKNIFLTSGQEDEIFEWYCSILIAQNDIPRVKQLISHPVRLAKSTSTPSIAMKVTAASSEEDMSAAPTFLKTGKLWKAGPDKLDSWRERWFTLHDNHLVYSRGKLTTYASGEIQIGATSEGYRVEKGKTKYSRSPPTEFTLTITTPWRKYHMCAENVHERDEWIEQVNRVIHYKNSTLLLQVRHLNMPRCGSGELVLKNASSTDYIHIS